MPPFPPFQPGDPVPWFKGRATNNPEFEFGAAAGRFIVLCFLGSAGAPPAQRVIQTVVQRARNLFDDRQLSFFGVSIDPKDMEERRVEEMLPGVRYFGDFDRAISRRFGAAGEGSQYRPFWLVLDPMLRVLASIPFDAEGRHAERVLAVLTDLPPVTRHAGLEVHAPVLVLPRVFEPAFCRHLIDLYRQHGGEGSGFMRDVDGRTVAVVDHRHKRRADYSIEDEAVRTAARERIRRRVVPEIHKAFQFQVIPPSR
jgi:peroxiredoxin